MLHVAAQAGEFFGDVAALGGDGGFLGQARWIERSFAEQFFQAGFEAAREGGARAFGERLELRGERGDVAQAPGHFFAQVTGFVFAHASSLSSASFRQRATTASRRSIRLRAKWRLRR